MYVYLKSKGEAVWTTGFYDPQGKWQPEMDFDSEEKAARRVNYLNGGEQ